MASMHFVDQHRHGRNYAPHHPLVWQLSSHYEVAKAPPLVVQTQQPPWWQSTVEQTTGKSWHRLTQDSDEVLDAEQGGIAWKVVSPASL